MCSSLTKGSIYHIKHVYTTFNHGSGLTWNWMFNRSIFWCLAFAYTAFLLCMVELCHMKATLVTSVSLRITCVPDIGYIEHRGCRHGKNCCFMWCHYRKSWWNEVSFIWTEFISIWGLFHIQWKLVI